MKRDAVLGVIPARYGATRLPGKPLAPILNRPMIEWVYRSARKALSHVVVATDDARIVRVVEGFGGKAVLTPKSCQSGTDRMFWVSKKIKAHMYVNVQGDEPLMHPSAVRKAVQIAKKNNAIGTVATHLSAREENDPNAVKVVLGAKARALYFSRSRVPFQAHGVKASVRLKKHLGVYAYPVDLLRRFVRLPRPDLERSEKLEQLRALYFGLPIYVAFTPHNSIGVDTRKDLKAVETILRKNRR